MPSYYNFEIKVDSGKHPDCSTLKGFGYLSDGYLVQMDINKGLVGVDGDGYTTLHMTTEPISFAGYDGRKLEKTEDVWFALGEAEMVDSSSITHTMFLIGPYRVSDIGTKIV